MKRPRAPPKQKRVYRFLAKQGKICHGAAAGYGKLPPKEAGSGAEI